MKWIFSLLLFSISLVCAGTPTVWGELAPGVKYTKITLPSQFAIGEIHAFKLDLSRYRLALAIASDNGKSAETAANFAKANHAILAINGGFFSPDHEPLGLRINNGKLQNKLKRTSWWGVFFIRNNKPSIVSMRNFRYQKNIQFAIQGGPRLLINGNIPKLKPGLAERTALGITHDNQLIILVTNNLPLSTTDLAEIMKKPEAQGGLDCQYALNLDGGNSTQLYVDLPNFHLYIAGLKPVADAVLVLPRVEQ